MTLLPPHPLLFTLFFAVVLAVVGHAADLREDVALGGLERPFIWVTESDRPSVLEKIEEEDWARSLFEQMRERVDSYVDQHEDDPGWFLSRVQLTWSGPNYTYTEYDEGEGAFVSSGDADHPTVRFMEGRMPRTSGGDAVAVPEFAEIPPYNDHPTGGMILKRRSDGEPSFVEYIDRYIRDIHRRMLEMAVDAGVLYWITGEEKYASFAADILSTFVEGLYPKGLVRGDNAPQHNWGIVSNNHLLEARWFSNLLPIIYDFVYPHLEKDPMIYDVVRREERPFNHDHAQEVFRKYITLALERGIRDCNWVVFEAASLLHCTLALNDGAERADYLRYFFDRDTRHQQSMATFMTFFTEDAVWFESPAYAEETTAFIAYLMALVDRLQPEMRLPEKYPVIFEAPHVLPRFRFPNCEYIVFGDTHRDLDENPLTFELIYNIAEKYGMKPEANKAAGAIQRLIADGEYDRSAVEWQRYVYYQPVKLLWFSPKIPGEAEPVPMHRTETMDHAGVILQRNGNDPETAMMTWMGGGHHVHAAASGIHMEIYGRGEVVGAGGGRGGYLDPVHIEYLRNYASHNTVIVNNASRGKGGWIDIYQEPLDLLAVEPLPTEAGVSPYHSFATVGFVNYYGSEVKKADQMRTMALIRTSEDTGYYLDIFRSRTREPDPAQTHDYLYHNIGHALTLKGDFRIVEPPDWFGSDVGDPFRQPGTHWFEPELATEPTASPLLATFRTTLGKTPVRTEVRMPGGPTVQAMEAMAPATADAPRPYNGQPTPTLIVRQTGEAWTEPFVATYEVFAHHPGNSVRSVERLPSSPGATAVRVASVLPNGDELDQVVVASDGQTRTWQGEDFSMTGHFGIFTRRNGLPDSLYLGSAEFAVVLGKPLSLPDGVASAYIKFQNQPQTASRLSE